ncbi:hypothetical protein D3C71_1589720 [compost metagenome]
MLVGAADIGGNHAQDHAMVNALAARVFHFWIGDGLHLDLACAEIHDTTITRHAFTSLLLL